jgi:hypothetical protein
MLVISHRINLPLKYVLNTALARLFARQADITGKDANTRFSP